LRSIVLAAEVAFLVVLLAGAALMQRTLSFLGGLDTGVAADRVMSVRLVQVQTPLSSDAATGLFVRDVLQSVERIPGVERAAVAWPFDYSGFTWAPNINLPDRPFMAGQEPVVQAATVTGKYFETMGIPVLRGRNFGPQERPGAPVGVIVNNSFVNRFFPGEDPLGKRVSGVRIPEMQNMPIVGVVGDTRRGGMLRGFTPEIYVSYDQFPQSHPTLVVRAAAGNPLRFTTDVVAAVTAIDSTVAVRGASRLADDLAASYGDRRALSWLLSTFAALALVLTVLGIASVVSFSVAQRTSEIGIRMALGADARGIVRLMIAHVLRPLAFGAAAGVLTLVPLSRLIGRYVVGVSPADPVSIAMAISVLLASALIAAYVPARRAAAVDPLTALRST
jgi:putative ABC transport system permease protein